MLASELLAQLNVAIAKFGDHPVYIDGDEIVVSNSLAVMGTHLAITHFVLCTEDTMEASFGEDYGAAEVD